MKILKKKKKSRRLHYSVVIQRNRKIKILLHKFSISNLDTFIVEKMLIKFEYIQTFHSYLKIELRIFLKQY